MPQQTRETIKKYFEKGDVPTAGQFSDLIDSVPNITDDGFNTIIYPKGDWTSGVSYLYGDTVYYEGSTYYCLVAHTSEAAKVPPSFPEEQNTWWKVLAKRGDTGDKGDKGDTGEKGSQGDKGDKGDQGIQGIQGVKGDTGNQGIQGVKGDKGDTGATGAQGIQGIQGIPGIDGLDITWKGAYDNLTAYVVNDAVSYNGSSYTCKLISTGNLPTNSTYWDLLAQKGLDGQGSGDMLASVYDPTNKNADAFDMDNMVEGTDTKIMTADERTNLANQSGVNTGDQTISDIRPIQSGTFLSGSNNFVQTDANVTVNSIVDVYAQSTPIGAWTVVSAAGSFTITSTKTETSNVDFEYFINN